MADPPIQQWDPVVGDGCGEVIIPPPVCPATPPGKQCYNIAVPFSASSLSFGVSAGQGGQGASLVSSGSVLVDSGGPADIQALGNLAGQTHGSLSMMSLSGITIGTPASILVSAGAEIKAWAGSSMSPGPCGTGGPGAAPAAPAPGGDGPAKDAEARVAGLTAAVKIGAGIAAVAATSGAAAGAAAVGAAATAMGSGSGDAIAGIASGNPVGAIAAVVGAASAASGPGGPTKVDIQGPAGIKMMSMAKIQGTAANTIELSAGVKFSGVAGAEAEMQASGILVFGLGKATLKGLGGADIGSWAYVKFDAPAISVAGGAKFGCTGTSFTMKGTTFDAAFSGAASWTTPTMTFSKNVKVLGKLEAKDYAEMKDDVECDAEATIKEDLDAKKGGKIKEGWKSAKGVVKKGLEVVGVIKTV